MQFLPRDAEYLATQPREMLSFPEPLKDGLPKNWREVCEQEGYECLPFVSASLPNPPDLSFGRLLIVETGALFDRWMLYTTPREGDETKERLIDFLGVEKASIDPATGELIPLQKTRLHFAEYWRDRDGKSPVYRKNIAACYKCHPSGMRDIIPAYGSVDEEGEALADSLNQKMAEYGDFDWGAGTINVAAYGPPMGEKQGCTDCHDGVLRGSLNAAHLGERSRHQIYFKMVQSLVMPPDVTSPPIAVAKAKLLAAQDKGELYQTNPLKTLTTMLRVDLGSDRGPMAASNEEILYLLSRRELITQEEYDAAMLEQKEREQNASDLYEEMTREYRTTLEEWLRGERDACAGLFSVD